MQSTVDAYGAADTMPHQEGIGSLMLTAQSASDDLQCTVTMQCKHGWCDEGSAPSLPSIWGASAKNIWAVGESGSMSHYDGNAWTTVAKVTSKNLNAIWGASATDIWAVADDGVIVHYDGHVWTPNYNTGTTDALRGIWGTSNIDVWVVGYNRTLLHFDGFSWKIILATVGAIDPDYHNFNDVRGLAANDVWIVGPQGPTYHYDGTNWVYQISSSIGIIDRLRGGDGTLWGVRDYRFIKYASGSWSEYKIPEYMLYPSDVISVGVGDAWAVGQFKDMLNNKAYGLMHWNGTEWTPQTAPFDASDYLTQYDEIWGTGQELWVFGVNILHRLP